MELNNKGFAISSIMYIILIFVMVLIMAILGMLSSRKMMLDKIKNKTRENIKNNLGNIWYYVGDKIKVNNEYYYVIKDSPKNKDYVVALKEKPLTTEEIERFGENHINVNTQWYQGEVDKDFDHNGYPTNQYGRIVFYSSDTCPSSNLPDTNAGCATSYDDSDIKHIVDNWANNKFNNKLRIVNNYEARLLTTYELNSLGCSFEMCSDIPYEWVYDMGSEFLRLSQDIEYVLMDVEITKVGPHIHYLGFEPERSITSLWLGYEWSSYTYVRPVINVYKSAIEME